MSELYWDTVSSHMRQVMLTFNGSEIGARFYLAGGTALALQLGHRISVDLDYFSETLDIPLSRNEIMDALKIFNPLLADASFGNLNLLVDNLRVGYYGYGYPMIAPFILESGVRLASIVDIGLMKLDAILARASRKDFVDLFMICQQQSLRSLLDMAPQKFHFVRDFESQVTRRLVYFERADEEEPVPMIQSEKWEEIKRYFREQAKSIGKSWMK